VTHFKQAYDAAFDAKFKGMPGAKKFGTANGTIDEALWGAIFDCYEYGLCCELGDMETSTEGKDELTRLRGELRWVDDNHKTMGFGEKFPIDNVTKNDFRSQSNRRVEIMMFDDGEEPDLAAAATNPEGIETYLPGVYGKVPVKPPWTARRVRVRICSPEGLPLSTWAFTSESVDGKTDGITDTNGWASIPLPESAEILVVRWLSPTPINNVAATISREVHIRSEITEEGYRRRLLNLGYLGNTIEELFAEFRGEFDWDDSVDDDIVKAELVRWHDGDVRPSAFSAASNTSKSQPNESSG
jgi:hypothetical protein